MTSTNASVTVSKTESPIRAAHAARALRVCAAVLAVGVLGVSTMARSAPASLSAAQIVEKNVAARGGLTAWRAVQTMSWTGKMDVGSGDSTSKSARFAEDTMAPKSRRAIAQGAGQQKGEPVKQVQVPFVVDMKRPALSRVEIEFAGKTAVQVYDGKQGWKLRPFLNRNDVEPFTDEEIKASAGEWEMDGLLLDYSAKGTKVEFEAVEPVEGRDAYRLKLTQKSGAQRHVWIDAQNFLDVKVEGAPRRMDGRMHQVWIYQRDFRSEKGVIVPHVFETAVDGYPETHKMMIEKVAVNPAFNDSLFAKPSGA